MGAGNLQAETAAEVSRDRILGRVGDNNGPTIVFVAGLHGNEQTGVIALKKALDELGKLSSSGKVALRGRVIGVCGNLAALSQNCRFVDEDLNRVWELSRLDGLQRKSEGERNVEEQELGALLNTFESILRESQGPFYFIDLHSTSSRTVPHIIINDRLENRKLSFKYPLPVILGIDSFVAGTMLSFIDEMGHRAIGFEGGRHDQPHTIDSILAFFWLTLVFTGALPKKQVPGFKEMFERLLVASQGHRQVYEVFHRFHVGEDEQFQMVPGYNNFQPVIKGQYLADCNGASITARSNGFVFLPRYERQGNSGFYMLHKLSKSWLGMSAFLRKIKFERFLAMLPGVEKVGETDEAYNVNQKVARFFAAELFHLLGYRRLLRRDGQLVVAKRTPKYEE